MSMMMRRGAATGQRGERAALDPSGDLRFPETAVTTASPWPVVELRARLESLATQRFTGYLGLRRSPVPGLPEGLLLFSTGQLIAARLSGSAGSAALTQLFATDGDEITCGVHTLPEGAVFALASTFLPPQLPIQPMGADGGEVALLLRDLAGVRHSGTVQISAASARRGLLWVRILMHEGKFLGVYSVVDRRLKPSLADVNDVLSEASPQLTLFAIQNIPPPLTLPMPAPAAPPPPARPSASAATSARDELLETDLVWYLSRFERAFGRLKERRDPQADLLRAFGELTNELAGFVAALQHGTQRSNAGYEVVAAELNRARAAGIVTVDLKLGKWGIDAAGVAKQYGTYPKHSAAATGYFAAASVDMLTLIGRLMERMLAAFHDPTTAGFAREGCETLLREVRGGLGELTQR